MARPAVPHTSWLSYLLKQLWANRSEQTSLSTLKKPITQCSTANILHLVSVALYMGVLSRDRFSKLLVLTSYELPLCTTPCVHDITPAYLQELHVCTWKRSSVAVRINSVYPPRVKTSTRKCGNCNALQLEATNTVAVILGFNYDAHTKVSSGSTYTLLSYSVILLIDYVTLWPWPLSMWHDLWPTDLEH